MNNTEYLSAQ